MNPAKLLEDILSVLHRYAPIIVVHVLLLVWLSAQVLDPGALQDGYTVWDGMKTKINSALMAIGLSLELWYVLTALVIAYLAAFQWVRSFVTRLPFLGVRYITRYEPELLGYAGKTLQMRPDIGKISQSLNDLVNQYSKELSETNQPHPYQWQFDREDTWSRYYGTLLVALGGSLAWTIEGGSLARTTGDVWNLVFLLGLICIVVRWRMRRLIAYGQQQLGFWALREFERRTADNREDPLRWQRGQLIEKQAKFQAAARKQPAMIVQSILYRLPKRFARRLQGRLRLPHWRLDDDWDIFASCAMKYKDEAHLPPEALRVDGLLTRFTGLLECSGAGICILAPQKLGFAPAVPGGGATYSFAKRRHDSDMLTVTLTCGYDLSHYALQVLSSREKKVFLAEVGDHPIELVAQFDFPDDRRKWSALINQELDEEYWPSRMEEHGKVMGNITLSKRLSMHPGSTYLMRSKSRQGTQTVVAFQCFQVEGSAKILLAWRILGFHNLQEEAPKVLAWWQPKAWKGLWDARTDDRPDYD